MGELRESFLVAQLGARMHYAIPRMMHDAGILERFYTDICAIKGWPRLLHVVPRNVRPASLHRLLGRVPHGVPPEKISAMTNLGWTYSKAKRNAVDGNQAAAVHIAFGKRFCMEILSRGFGKATAVYTFNSAGLELLKAARQAGLKTVMEQTIAPRAVELEILCEAVLRYPAWGETVPGGETIDAFICREEEEWQYADLILCGSEFVREGIARQGGPVDRCAVVPYGVDNRFQIAKTNREPGPLRVLTVGQVGLRKGAPVVWDAARMLGTKAEFRMVGSIAIPDNVYAQKPENVSLTGPMPRNQIVDHYRWADVFLLPSLCEGSATVTYEAMLAGLPVICTSNTGSTVIDGISGHIVPVFSAEAIAVILSEWIDKPEALEHCRRGVFEQISQLGLSAYRQRLLSALCTL